MRSTKRAAMFFSPARLLRGRGNHSAEQRTIELGSSLEGPVDFTRKYGGCVGAELGHLLQRSCQRWAGRLHVLGRIVSARTPREPTYCC